jgi:hypothetical protein
MIDRIKNEGLSHREPKLKMNGARANLGAHVSDRCWLVGLGDAMSLSQFVRSSRQERERASVDLRKEVGDTGFHLKAKGGKTAIDELIKKLNEAL